MNPLLLVESPEETSGSGADFAGSYTERSVRI
jgi:hypothetical protein